MAGFVLDIYIEWIIRVSFRFAREIGTGRWPVYHARVTGAFCPKVGYGCEKAEVNYTYCIDGKIYVGTNVKPFVFSNSANIYAAQFPKGKQISVRVKPNNPSFSLLLDSEND
jgi:hypothetical protein